MIKSLLFSFVTFWSAVGYAEQQTGEVLVDRIAAIVNSVPILHSEVEEKVRSGFINVSYYPAEETASPYEKALQDAINLELILQRAEELEIEVADADLDAEIDQTLTRRGQNRELLLNALEQAGMTFEDYREDFRKQIIFRRFQGMVIRPLIKITDRDVETYYLKKSGSSSENIRLKIRQILIAIPEGSSAEVAEGKHRLARTIHKKLQAGMKFEEAVKLYSDDLEARERGGLMPADLRLGDLAEVIREPIAGLSEGDFTHPIKTPVGFFLFYLESKNFAGGKEFDREKRRLETELFIAEGEAQTRRWLQEFRKKNEVKTIQ